MYPSLSNLNNLNANEAADEDNAPMSPPPVVRDRPKRSAAASVAGDSEFGASVADGGDASRQRAGDEALNDEAFPAAPPPHGVGVGSTVYHILQKFLSCAVLADPQFRLESVVDSDFDPRDVPQHLGLLLDMSPSMGVDNTKSRGSGVVTAAHTTAELLRSLPGYLETLQSKLPSNCRPGGSNEPTLCIAGFSGSAGWHDDNGFLPSSRTGQTVAEARAWASERVGSDEWLKAQTVKWSECAALCEIWASHMEAIVYPENDFTKAPPGVRGTTGNGTNIDAGLSFATEALARICAQSGGHAHCIVATDGEANHGRRKAKEWNASLRERAMSEAAARGLPVSFSALMMGSQTKVDELSKLTNKRGVLGYAAKSEHIKAGLDGILSMMATDGRGCFDVASNARFVDAKGVLVEGTAEQLTVSRLGMFVGDNFEGFFDVRAPSVSDAAKAAMKEGTLLQVETWVAPSLLWQVRKGDSCAKEPHQTIDALRFLQREGSIPAPFVTNTEVVLEDGPRRFFQRNAYELAPVDASLQLDIELETSHPDSVYTFVKRNGDIEAEAYSRLAAATTHDEAALVAEEMASRSARYGSARQAARFRSLQREATASQVAADAGDEDAIYRSAGHSAAACFSQSVAAAGDEDDLYHE